MLTVRGRKSGQPRSAPIVMTEYDGKRYLIGTFGNVNWVRNPVFLVQPVGAHAQDAARDTVQQAM